MDNETYDEKRVHDTMGESDRGVPRDGMGLKGVRLGIRRLEGVCAYVAMHTMYLQ